MEKKNADAVLNLVMHALYLVFIGIKNSSAFVLEPPTKTEEINEK